MIAALEIVKVAAEQRVAVEVEQAALLGHEESEVLPGGDLGDLAERLVLGVVVTGLGAAVALLLEVEELPLGNAERLVDRLVQVWVAIFPQQVLGLVAHHQVAAPGNTEL